MAGAFDDGAFDIGAFDGHAAFVFVAGSGTFVLTGSPTHRLMADSGTFALAGGAMSFTSGAAPVVLALSLEPGTKIIYSWATTVITSYAGGEQRESPYAQPQRRFEGTAFLLDASSRDIRGALMRAAARGATFMLAVPMEELTFSADSSGTTVTVVTTTLTDWLVAGQRAVVVSPSGVTATAVIQSTTSTTITLDATLGTTGVKGARMMPLLPVLLDSQQGFARYPVTVDTWEMRARANAYGWQGADRMGIGATIVTYTAGAPVAVADLTDDDLLIWDRPNLIDETANESMLSQTEIVDMGGLPAGFGGALVPDWGRSIKYRSTSAVDWQWLKAFLRQLRGRQKAFVLSTNRPDFILDSTISGGIKIKSASVAGGGDYVSWFASDSHRRLALTLSTGAIQYVTVNSATDNLDGTVSLVFDLSVSGTVTRISMAEQVRFVDDAIEVTWDGGMFSVEEAVQTVEETLTPPTLIMFDTILTPAAYLNNFTNDPNEIALTLGQTTLINTFFVNPGGFATSGSFSGIAATGGNVDGMVVCLISPTNGTFTATTIHNSSSASSLANRFLNIGAGNRSTSAFGSMTYRYSGAISRWVLINDG